jgi:hypothetical protein
MQNLSTGKLIAIFVGFLLAVGGAAVFIMKSTAQSGENTTVTVTKKHHRVEQARADVEAPAAQAQASSASIPTTDQMMGLAPTVAAATPQDAASNAAPQATQAQAPASNAIAMQSPSGAAVASNATASPVAASNSAGCRNKAVTQTQAPRVKRHKSNAVAKKPATKTEAERELVRMDGYKTMAVVGHRAWIVDPDGTPDNVANGEEVHAKPMRVRSVDKESSVVITTTDQYIDAQ